jgi:division protein CdvB (Snf7/Vps24/ESCRT-III family)
MRLMEEVLRQEEEQAKMPAPVPEEAQVTADDFPTLVIDQDGEVKKLVDGVLKEIGNDDVKPSSPSAAASAGDERPPDKGPR